jgi:mitofilin
LEILQKQRLEFEDLMARRMREQEHELTLQANKALQEKDANIQSVLGKALELQQNEHETDKKAFEQLKHAEIQVAMEEKYGKMMEEYKAKVAADLQQKVATLNALTQKLRHLESALEASKTSQQGSLKAHRLSAAALSLAEKLETSESAATELAALKAAAGHEGVICTACATIPESVQTTGVLTLAQLQARFSAAQKKCRQAALVPTGRLGLEGQLAGIFLAAIKYPPDPDDPAPESDKDNAEFVLARANRFVQHGELERAVEQLEKLQGQPAFTISDWMKDALDRIAVEKALKVIKMECALLNESCLDD